MSCSSAGQPSGSREPGLNRVVQWKESPELGAAMFQGHLESIYIGPKKALDLERVEQVEAVAGRGLTGDRYALQEGTFSKPGHADREVTLIEIEAIEAVAH